jgi:hypothetical protein
MKTKLLYYLIASIALIFASCTNDDNSDNNSLILPKTITYRHQDNTIYQTATFTYDGNKIVSISSEKSLIEFTYDGNQIVKEIQYSRYEGKETKYYEILYTYLNDKLETGVLTFGSQYQYNGKKYMYSYNEDGTVKKETYDTDIETGKQSENYSTDILTFENGNLIKSVSNWEDRPYITTCRYEYDVKNNAFKNILGLNLLLDLADFSSEFNFFSLNNINTFHVVTNLVPGTDPKLATIAFEPFGNTMNYEYNKKGYPTKRTTYDYKGDIKEIIEYTY